ncbi:hypothetical protein KTQ42_19365 [Noviherbaspirillum sp. L7-7A]|uniref:hypothetical protein n=1 Tax=Noviherbaspirillum sp. L7-7A TaxID=2850560 RepID=UPI001C2C78D4|nr:hypothetical protein [Noviherbaspirillum sp. L7-7A]MBV0881454.1 hypothetical protein [Noviherbaspirillum sp. L7-7A]
MNGFTNFDVPVRGRLLSQRVKIGSVWVSIMEPSVGCEVAFNEWYADDHFYAGGMNLPWIFAGRRWICPREYQALRLPASSSIAEPLKAGCFLHLNFFAQGHMEEATTMLGDTIASLAKEGRMYVDTILRRHVFSRLQPYVGTVYANPEENGPLDIQALSYPFDGVVVEILKASPNTTRDVLLQWLAKEFIPTQIGPTEAEMCLICLDADLPDTVTRKTSRVPAMYGDEANRRLTLLWFVENDPATNWQRRFASHYEVIGATGLGEIEFSSPFIPTLPGTNRHIDRLR